MNLEQELREFLEVNRGKNDLLIVGLICLAAKLSNFEVARIRRQSRCELVSETVQHLRKHVS